MSGKGMQKNGSRLKKNRCCLITTAITTRVAETMPDEGSRLGKYRHISPLLQQLRSLQGNQEAMVFGSPPSPLHPKCIR